MDLDAQMKQMQRRLDVLEGSAPKPAIDPVLVANDSIPRLDQIDRALHELVNRVTELERLLPLVAGNADERLSKLEARSVPEQVLTGDSTSVIIPAPVADTPAMSTKPKGKKKRHASEGHKDDEQSDT